MLDDFSSTKIADSNPTQAAVPITTAPTQSGPGRPEVTALSDEQGNDTGPPAEEDFAKQLQAGFAEMMKDLESNPEMAKQFEELMAQFGGAAAGATPPPNPAAPAASAKGVPAPTSAAKPTQTSQPSTSATAAKPSEENFQDTIRRTMERMRASDSSASTAPAASEDDMMANLLKELASAEGAGGEGEEGFSKMLLGMMEQLTNKEILYEPMKELDTKFPDWLEKNGAALKKDDRERYETQRVLVGEIVARFEKKGYSDSNTDDREYVVERMQKV